MSFVDLSLARRIEAAEADLAASIARCAEQDGQPSFVQRFSGGLAAFARPGAPVNKAVGAALGCPLNVDELDTAERAMAKRGEPLRVELATIAEPGAARMLSARGFRLEGFEYVLGLSLAGWNEDEEIGGVGIAEEVALHPWSDVLIDGFCQLDDSPVAGQVLPREVLENVMCDFARVDGLGRYVARLDGEVVGAASLRMHDGIALLCGASTLPAARRRGVQTALLRTRLRDAKARGCEMAIVTTTPGSRSQSNVMRRGFAILYARAIMVGGVR